MAANEKPLVTITEHQEPKVRNPVFIEGLPGVGHVGKLAADHLIDVTDAHDWCTIHCRDFPPQAVVEADGLVRRVENTLWISKAPKVGGRDLIIMTGDVQPLTGPGQHDLVEAVLEKIQATGCKEIYTLGGYGLGSSIDDPEVLGAATDVPSLQKMTDMGVRFDEGEPSGGIIGASGLFLSIAPNYGMQGGCLMGETSGYVVDPKAAQAVLEVVVRLTGRSDVQFEDLDDRAAEMERLREAMERPDRHASQQDPAMEGPGDTEA